MAETTLIQANKDSTKRNEAAMLRAAQEGRAGFKQLYLQWLTPVYRYFYYRTGNVKDAEDLTSQVFLKVYEELPVTGTAVVSQPGYSPSHEIRRSIFFVPQTERFPLKPLIQWTDPMTYSLEPSIPMKSKG